MLRRRREAAGARREGVGEGEGEEGEGEEGEGETADRIRAKVSGDRGLQMYCM